MPRFLEVALSLAGLVLLSPLFAILAVGVKMHDGGPVLYRARRVGRGGKEFSLLKFRSMIADADRRGLGLTVQGDPRVTPIGRLLRRTKLDELPQLLNVFRGEMSFVGPRPEDPRYVSRYTPEQRHVLDHRPGITSPASLAYRNEESLLGGEDGERVYVERILPHKLSLELDYFPRKTVWTDLGIILRTVKGLFA